MQLILLEIYFMRCFCFSRTRMEYDEGKWRKGEREAKQIILVCLVLSCYAADFFGNIFCWNEFTKK